MGGSSKELSLPRPDYVTYGREITDYFEELATFPHYCTVSVNVLVAVTLL